MKRILIFCTVLVFAGCMSKEVELGDPDLQLKGDMLYYKEKPFTGTLTKRIPLTDKKIKINYKKGLITSQ